MSLTPKPPRYQHDCDRCQFIARVASYDVYRCSGNMGDSLIARYGDEGSQYASRCDFRNEAVTAARRRWAEIAKTDPDRAERAAVVEALFGLLPTLITNLMSYDAGTGPAQGDR